MAGKKKITFQFFIPVNGEYKPLTEDMLQGEEWERYQQKICKDISSVLSAMAGNGNG